MNLTPPAIPDPPRDAATQAASPAASAPERRPDIATYLRERVEPQLAWHENAAHRSKRLHWGLSTVQLGATAFIPIVNTMGDLVAAPIVTSLLAGCAAIAAGFNVFAKHHETWLRSRRTVASLEEVLALYRHGVAPFDTSEADSRLVRAVEDILGGENQSWQAEMAKKSQTSGIRIDLGKL